jgi:hypothetical protein
VHVESRSRRSWRLNLLLRSALLRLQASRLPEDFELGFARRGGRGFRQRKTPQAAARQEPRPPIPQSHSFRGAPDEALFIPASFAFQFSNRSRSCLEAPVVDHRFVPEDERRVSSASSRRGPATRAVQSIRNWTCGHGMVFVPGLRFPSRAHQELFELTQQGGPSISPHKEQPGRCLFSEVEVSLLLNRTFEYEGLCDDKSDQVRPSNNSKG